MSFVHVICILSRVRRFPLQRGLKCIKSMLVSISALAFVCCVEVCVHSDLESPLALYIIIFAWPFFFTSAIHCSSEQ